MTVKRFGRRMFLGAAGGGLLAMPWLPSILSKDAQAAGEVPRCFVSLRTNHGGIVPQAFYPDVATLDRKQGVLDWQAQWSQTQSMTQNGDRVLSPVVRAKEENFSEGLAKKLGFLMGVDYAPTYVGHNIAAHLGGYAQENFWAEKLKEFKPTMDQILGHSKALYATSPSHRVVGINQDRGSWYHAIGTDLTSPVVAKPGFNHPHQLWLALFQPGGNGTVNSRREWAVDRAVESYRELARGSSTAARRLSPADRQRLEMHMAALYDIQGQITLAKSCERTVEPSRDRYSGVPKEEWELYAQMIQRAVTCGISRVFNIGTSGGERFLTEVGNNFHEAVAHRAAREVPNKDDTGTTAKARSDHQSWYRMTFANIVLPILNALNVDDGMGHNILDESFLMWTSECGMLTHSSEGVPLMTAGSLGGKLHTGRFIDYRNMADMRGTPNDSPKELVDFWHHGLPYDQLLGTVLQGFGVDKSEYDTYRLYSEQHKIGQVPKGQLRIGGYGGYLKRGVDDRALATGRWSHPEAVRLAADQPLPLLWKS